MLRLHNSLTQRVEELRPLKGQEVTLYTCGPTVYDFVHIGNFRTFVFQDLLRRWIRYKGFAVRHVMNITDVDDRIIQNAREADLSIDDYTGRYAEAFFEDMQKLRMQRPEVMPRATDHIQEMIQLILTLREKGYTYESEGSTYFRIDRFPQYGKLSHLDLSEMKLEGRIDADSYSKENPRDFVLWKSRKPGEAYWDSPLGPGRPGWHIECSAMSMKYLGESFDIHCGGVDLIFPHHENEVAQSEGATGKPFVRHWVHSAHLIIEGEKMSKSLGNILTLRGLIERGHDPAAIRYLLLAVHYRKQLNFTTATLHQAQSALQRANDFLLRVREIPESRPENPQLARHITRARADFEARLDDDLNTSAALAAFFELIRQSNILLEQKEVGTANRDQILELAFDVNQVFDVWQIDEPKVDQEEIMHLITERAEARRKRDYRRADEIRTLLARRGIILEDTRQGTRWKKVG